ncbi:multiple organellar RNA editing factor 8, chloroplastic/mitochondrial-like [Phragmites australis]|uniref:multiple organellar RNA editing factor 8, chloroplastic/mitochondrial-like n=1 Tax=Phragmites australis TaxID=29695 RepID=UPI002D77EF40|nr:multiple organellar RNA editing factor 8, chloroplastic/mitochondrial-like [Phragmites australis]
MAMASTSRALRLARLSSPLRGAAASRPLRPLAGASGSLLPAALRPSSEPARFFATHPATSSLRDSSPNWTNRPPKETILLDGCDFEHWLVVMEPPPGDPGNPEVTRDEIIESYIKTLAQVVGSEEEARHKIYSVSTRHYFAFGALVSEELSYKLKELPKVLWVLPDSYLDVKNKDYGGEPFINGEAVPYDPKYHEEWVRNNARANERSRRNDRPRNFDRSRNFERRRENMQNFQNRDASPGQGFNTPPPGQNPMPPREAPPMHHAQGSMPPPPPPNAGTPPTYQPHAPNTQAGYAPGGGQNYQQGFPCNPGYQGGPPGNQAGNQGYQGNPGGNMHSGPGPAYQSNNPGYQGGGPGYQGGRPPPFPGGGQPPFPGGGQPPFPGGNPSYQGGSPSYGDGAPGYQGQAGNPSYQQGGGNYNAGAPTYEGRDGPGRNYQ